MPWTRGLPIRRKSFSPGMVVSRITVAGFFEVVCIAVAGYFSRSEGKNPISNIPMKLCWAPVNKIGK